MPKNIEISIVIPAYNEEGNILFLYKKLKAVLDKLNKKYEIIFVDDGSTDTTFSNLEKIHKDDSSVKIIRFRKNFGQTAAMDAGFKHAQGDVIISMDADLQNDPKDIPNLLAKLEEGYDVVSGWRYKRKDPFSKKIFSKGANMLRKFLTKEKIHDPGCTLRAYKKECFEDLNLYGEMHRFIPILLMWKGFKVSEVKVEHRPRIAGKTKYNTKRLLKGFLDLLVVKFWMQYGTRPVHLFGGVGILTSLIGFIIALVLSIQKIFFGVALANRPLLLLAVLLIVLGIQFVIFGFLGDIMVKVYYDKEKRKPYNIKIIK